MHKDMPESEQQCDNCKFGIENDDKHKPEELTCFLNPPELVHSRALVSGESGRRRPSVKGNDFCKNWE